MPAAVVKSLAKQYGVSVATVERYWEDAKQEYDGNWAAVTGTVKKRLRNAAQGRRRTGFQS